MRRLRDNSGELDRPVVVMFERFGPYHRARLAAASALVKIVAVEVVEQDSTYSWAVDRGAIPCERVTLFRRSEQATPRGKVFDAVTSALNRLDPCCVVVPGWSANYSIAALTWCIRHGVPAVLMSDSTALDAPRHWWSEYPKSRVVRLFGAALVAGSRHVEYVKRLGMAGDRIFTGYDVVDNEYFASHVRKVRADAHRIRINLSLPERYFLASARFVKKKNLFGLLDAFSRYRRLSGGGGWSLVLLGDGELRTSLEARIEELDLWASVRLPGFIPYETLPAYYGLAGAFVHASTVEQWGLVVNEAMAGGLPVLVSERCGCAPDLVSEGRNGYRFDPYRSDRLAELMLRLASNEDDREYMGSIGSSIVAKWGPERFAQGLLDSVRTALRVPVARAGALDGLLLSGLKLR